MLKALAAEPGLMPQAQASLAAASCKVQTEPPPAKQVGAGRQALIVTPVRAKMKLLRLLFSQRCKHQALQRSKSRVSRRPEFDQFGPYTKATRYPFGDGIA